MMNSVENQLPEVGSLPDGFMESSVELSSPRTPTFESGNSLADYKDTMLELNDLPTVSSNSLTVSEIRLLENRGEKVENLRTFPVPLSDSEGVVESREGVLVDAVPEASVRVSSYDEPTMGSSHEHEHVEEDCQISKRTSKECSELQATNLKERSTPESAESLKNGKQEISEVGHENVKRSFKSEKEFLELTFKYQQVMAERDAAIAVQDKLESLCRELQRQNKLFMEECNKISTEGQNMRLDLSTKFHDAIKDVNSKFEEQKSECLSHLKENEMLRNKLKHLSDQYAISEHQFEQKLMQKTLELQLADLKIQQHEEKLTQDQSQMKLYSEQVSQHLATEKNLRLRLAVDGEKFQQFQDALSKSNEVFETFKQEIEKMSKSVKELKKENIFLKSKCEKSDFTLVQLVEEREHWKKQLQKMKNQKEKLESLCRSLQAERKQNSVTGVTKSDPDLSLSKLGSSVEEF